MDLEPSKDTVDDVIIANIDQFYLDDEGYPCRKPFKGNKHSRFGRVFFRENDDGYHTVGLSHDFGYGKTWRHVQVHRIAFYLAHGYLPLVIDHIDGCPWNNKVSNLREATPSQNVANSKKPKTNTTGYKGVHLNKKTGKYYASIMKDGRTYTSQQYKHKEYAARSYNDLAAHHFGEFAKLNVIDKMPDPF